jgi:hypothetical protein
MRDFKEADLFPQDLPVAHDHGRLALLLGDAVVRLIGVEKAELMLESVLEQLQARK